MAVVFVTRMEGDKPINEGLCIKCAKEMNIKPVPTCWIKWASPMSSWMQWMTRWQG